jgi:hypothetical protein
MKSDNSSEVVGAGPTAHLSPPRRALWWLKKGGFRLGPEWDKAHEICQTAEGTFEYDLVHALAHWIEGDPGNRDYWYRRVKQQHADTIEAEWERVAQLLG